MSSPAEDIATILNDAGIGTLGTTLFVGKDDNNDEASIALYDNGGPAPNPKFARDFFDMQVRVAGNPYDYAGAYETSLTIKNYLLGVDPQSVGTKIYFGFNLRSDITFIGYDLKQRPLFTQNYRLMMDSGDVGNRVSL